MERADRYRRKGKGREDRAGRKRSRRNFVQNRQIDRHINSDIDLRKGEKRKTNRKSDKAIYEITERSKEYLASCTSDVRR